MGIARNSAKDTLELALIRDYSGQNMQLLQALDASVPDLRRLQRSRKQVAWFAVVPCAQLLTVVESAWRAALPVAR
jgi:hypothetical protein